ncbi:P-loop containing nucleoside triphosphate hydrolase protein [Lophiotrema nucula]|uniref:P-loop containing nucleoside triphosphate hydrolase protein n=1 Tax=Lophiotrema nucula TaxID=690887 RepID=A0A6A5YMG8_9PLEO|nr:P-loop containing nucleoside triphosphate hydrolase protein [Lophiotrema nucula]
MSSSLEDNIRHVLGILAPKIKAKHATSSHPIILGITGLQGSGKSTWASKIVELLPSSHGLSGITVSLDDFYKTHDDLIVRREQDPENKLYRTRGQPGTHDERLAGKFFEQVRSWKDDQELKIPSFDKSQFNGEGDRAPEDDWPVVKKRADVVVFEGWCVGFQSIAKEEVERKRGAAQTSGETEEAHSIKTLGDHQVSHLQELNANLKRYNEAFMGPQHFDFMIHIDTDDLHNVYTWRLQQEHAMWKVKGSGMSDEAVVAFVRGYMPGYELYLEGLRQGFFKGEKEGRGRQLRAVLDKGRGVEKVEEI